MENKQSIFEALSKVNVNDKLETKGSAKLKYLAWAYAWGECKKLYPDANYTIYETVNPQGYTVNYFTDGRTCWVKTGVTINGLEHIEELPVMDYNNKSIPLNSISSFDVNKTIQRSLTKALARHGLGLYVYAGEDLPDEEDLKGTTAPEKKVEKKAEKKVEEKQEAKVFPQLKRGLQEDAGSITNEQLDKIQSLGIDIPSLLEYMEIPSITDLSKDQAQAIIFRKENKQ